MEDYWKTVFINSFFLTVLLSFSLAVRVGGRRLEGALDSEMDDEPKGMRRGGEAGQGARIGVCGRAREEGLPSRACGHV